MKKAFLFLGLFLFSITVFSKGFLFFGKKFPKKQAEVQRILCQDKWVLVKLKAGLDVASGKKLGEHGLDMTIEFKTDGTAILKDNKKERKANYVIDMEHKYVILHRSGSSKTLVISYLKEHKMKMVPIEKKDADISMMEFKLLK